MADTADLLDVLVILAAAVVAAAIFQRLGTSIILGYLLAGIVIGESGLDLVRKSQTISVVAELGVVFLLFSVGLELPLQRLKALRTQMLTFGLGQILVSGLLLAVLLYIIGFAVAPALLLGGALSLSSTALVLRLLSESRELSTRQGRSAVSILLTQDIAVAVMLVAIGFLGATHRLSWLDASTFIALLFAGIMAFLVLGKHVLGTVFAQVAGKESPEAFLTCTLLIVLGSALLSQSAGLSMGLGAFLGGVLVAETNYRHQVAADIRPFRVLLLGLFFLTVGLSLKLSILFEAPLMIVFYLMSLILLKAIIIWILSKLAGYTMGEGLRLGMLLSQAGEFSLVLIALGSDNRILEAQDAQIFAVTVALSMIFTPSLARGGDLLQRWLHSVPSDVSDLETSISPSLENHVVIAGFGRLGQNLARRLSEEGTPFMAVDLNGKKVSWAKSRGFPIVFGDATRPEILDALHVEKSKALAVCLSDPVGSTRLVALVHYIFPDLKIIARAYDETHANELLQVGASKVISELAPTGQQFHAHLDQL